MSQWDDRIVNNPVWESLASVGPVLDQALTRDGIKQEDIEGLERIRAVLAFTGKRLAGAEPIITSPGPLATISKALRNALTEIQAFGSDGDSNRIATANSHMETVLLHVAQLPMLSTSEDLVSLKDAALEYRASLEVHVKRTAKSFEEQVAHAEKTVAEFKSHGDELRAKFTDLGNEFAAQRQRLSQLTSDYQGQFSTAQETRNQEYTNAQTARQNQFGSLMSDYSQRLADQNAGFTREKENSFKQYQEDVASLKKDYANSAKALLDEIEGHRRQVEKLVGVIGNLGVTSGYQKTANYARRSLWFWQVVTVSALGGVIIVGYKAFIPIVQGTFSWESFAARVFLCITVGVLAAYAAFQADRFFEIERRNRKMALELEAIGPYLAPLPQEMQDKFRIDIGDRSFGREESGISRRTAKSPASVIDVLMKSKDSREFFRQLLQDLLKSIKG